MPAQQGPPIGNVPTPDSYIRLKQNVEALQGHINTINDSITSMKTQITAQDKQLAQIQKLFTVQSLTP